MLIFDLDGTVIDSSHRQLAKPDGSLDLDAWREHSTPEKVAEDSLLPLARLMRHALATDQTVAICTARVLGDADRAFLREHGLDAPVVLSRAPGDARPDAMLKREALLSLGVDLRGATLYDDNPSVLAMASELGINAINAINANKGLIK